MHSDACATGRDHLCRQFKRFLRSEVEHRSDFRMVIAESRVLHHIFSGTDYPLRDPVLDVFILVVSVLLEDSDPDQMIDDLLRLFPCHIVHLSELARRIANAALLEAEHEPDFLFSKQSVKDPEVEMILFQASRYLAVQAVGDHFGQFLNEFFLFRVAAMMVTLIRIIPVIDKNVLIYFFYHNLSLYRSNL